MDEYRIILHVDMDAFFAAIEQRDHPEYRGRPVIVGADPKDGKGRGVVSAASYEARRFGVHSALPISEAYRRCPGGVFVKPRMGRYAEISDRVMDILGRYSPLVEQISVDEAFLDCTGTGSLFGPPEVLGQKIKKAVREETGLTASVGIASNKSVAKICSDLHKPDGLTLCPFGREREFLAPLPVERIWGVGKKTLEVLHRYGYRTMGDVMNREKTVFEGLLGKMGYHIWMLANGIDDRAVSPGWERKSMSEETTFEKDVSDDETVRHALLAIADSLSHSLRREGFQGRTITLKIRLQGFETYTRSRTLSRAADDMFTLRDIAEELYSAVNRRGRKIRRVGIKVSGLEESGRRPGEEQMELFSDAGGEFEGSRKNRKLENVLDHLREEFGSHVSRASLLKKK